jgi:D-serine deaminase-like pyridoxal phosphate-dependent protein
MEHSDPNPRRTWAEIDLGALRHNIAALRAPLPAGAGIMAVVKANAYGHGLRDIVGDLADRVEMFGVANIAEAREVRKYAPAVPVLILGPALPDERRDIVENGFIPSVSDRAEAAAFAEAGRGRRVPIHVIVDTGMGRIGVWQDEALAVVREMQRLPGIEIAGIFRWPTKTRPLPRSKSCAFDGSPKRSGRLVWATRSFTSQTAPARFTRRSRSEASCAPALRCTAARRFPNFRPSCVRS